MNSALNWFEVITKEGEWWKFDSFEEENSFYKELSEKGENVAIHKPADNWSEDNNSYEEIDANLEWPI